MGSKAVNLGIDSFYRDLTPDEFDNVLEFDFDHPDAIDWDECCTAIEKLRKRETTPIPEYSYSEYKRTGTIFIEPADIIIVEGMFALQNQRIRDLLDLKIFVHTDDEDRLARRILRDVETRQRTVKFIIWNWMKFVKSSYDEIIRPTMKYADLIVPNVAQTENKVALDIIIQNLTSRISVIT